MKHEDDTTVNPTERLILQAAEREFLDKGFAGARTTAIAEAAGVTHAMLHYYFRTKEKLFDRIVSEKLTLLKDLLAQSLSDFDSPLSVSIRNVIDRHLDFISSNPEMPRFLTNEIYSKSERAVKILDHIRSFAPTIIRNFQNKIDAAAAKGECRKVDAHMLALDIVSLNVFSFLAAPIVNAALGDCHSNTAEFLAIRKQENYDTIMRKLSL